MYVAAAYFMLPPVVTKLSYSSGPEMLLDNVLLIRNKTFLPKQPRWVKCRQSAERFLLKTKMSSLKLISCLFQGSMK